MIAQNPVCAHFSFSITDDLTIIYGATTKLVDGKCFNILLKGERQKERPVREFAFKVEQTARSRWFVR